MPALTWPELAALILILGVVGDIVVCGLLLMIMLLKRRAHFDDAE